MGVKNVILAAGEVTKVDPHYDMTFDQALSIKNYYGGNVESIACAFNYGYLQGMTAANSAGNNEGEESNSQSSMAETIIEKIKAADEDKLRNLSLFIDVFLEDKKPAKSI
jgi:hypothetical protein